jgi:hypothetical protein
LRISSPAKIENAQLEISDVLGNRVRIIRGINSSEVKIEKENLPAGIYFYCVKNNVEIIASGKMVVE